MDVVAGFDLERCPDVGVSRLSTKTFEVESVSVVLVGLKFVLGYKYLKKYNNNNNNNITLSIERKQRTNKNIKNITV